MNNRMWLRYTIVLINFTCHFVKCIPTVPEARLTLENVATSYNNYGHAGPGSYAFGYDIDDPATQNTQFREEERHPNGTITGSYGWLDSGGNVHMVRYIADAQGYRANVESIPNDRLYRSRTPGNLLNSLKP